MSFDETLQSIVDMEYDELRDFALRGSAEVFEYLKTKHGEVEAYNYLCNCIRPFMCADNVVNQKEYQLFCDVFCYSGDYDSFFELVKGGKRLINDVIDEFKYAPTDIQSSFVCIAAAFCAVNGTISSEETQMIAKYLDSMV